MTGITLFEAANFAAVLLILRATKLLKQADGGGRHADAHRSGDGPAHGQAGGRRPRPVAVAAADGVAWTVGGGRCRRLKRGRRAADRVGRTPTGIALGAQLAWVANAGDGTVDRVDRATGAVLGSPIGVGGRPAGIFVGTGKVLDENAGDGTVSALDAATAEVLGDPIDVGRETTAVAEGAGSVWVAERRRRHRLAPGPALGPGESVRPSGSATIPARSPWGTAPSGWPTAATTPSRGSTRGRDASPARPSPSGPVRSASRPARTRSGSPTTTTGRSRGSALDE